MMDYSIFVAFFPALISQVRRALDFIYSCTANRSRAHTTRYRSDTLTLLVRPKKGDIFLLLSEPTVLKALYKGYNTGLSGSIIVCFLSLLTKSRFKPPTIWDQLFMTTVSDTYWQLLTIDAKKITKIQIYFSDSKFSMRCNVHVYGFFHF